MLVREPKVAGGTLIPVAVLVSNPGGGVGVGAGVNPVLGAVFISDPGGVPLDAVVRVAVLESVLISGPMNVAGVGVPILHYIM